MLRVRLAGISLSLRLSCACLLLTVVCDVGRLGGGKVHRLPPLTQRMSGLAAAPAAARLRVSLRFVPQEGRITQYNLSLSTSSTRTAASKYGGALCRGSANPPGFSPALLRGGAGLRAALALQAVGLCATSSTSHHEASKLMRFSPNYWQTCARRRIRVSALHRSHASPSPLSRHVPHREHGYHH